MNVCGVNIISLVSLTRAECMWSEYNKSLLVSDKSRCEGGRLEYVSFSLREYYPAVIL